MTKSEAIESIMQTLKAHCERNGYSAAYLLELMEGLIRAACRTVTEFKTFSTVLLVLYDAIIAMNPQPYEKRRAEDLLSKFGGIVLVDHFWFLWNPRNRGPRKRQPSIAVALAERERLQAMFPGEVYHLYEARLVP